MTATSTSMMPEPEAHVGELEPLALLDEPRRRRMLGTILIAGAVFVTVVTVVFALLAGRLTGSTGISVGMDAAFLSSWLLRRRHLHTATVIALATLAVSFPSAMMQSGGLAAPVLVVMPLTPVVVASFAGARGAMWLSVLLVLGTVGVWLATALHLVPPSVLPGAARDTMGAVFALSSVALAAFVARAAERERKGLEATLHERSRALYERSVHDPLTQLYNRRYLTHRLDEELAFAVRHGTELGVILVDVDHFKDINDAHGHGGGDEVLVALGRALHGGLRREDVVARYGGEEFAIVLRGLGLADVAVAAERIRRAIEEHDFLVAGVRVPVTVSLGCASLASCGEIKAVGHLLAVADARLYRAKRSGRNRVAFTD